MIYLNGKPTRGFALGDEAAFKKCFTEALDALKAFAASLSQREEVVLKIGLAASHLEESIAHGDWMRAEAHADNLMKLLARLNSLS